MSSTGRYVTDNEILEAAYANGVCLMRTEWVGTDRVVWTWQDRSRVLDTRNPTYWTKRAALDAMAAYLEMACEGAKGRLPMTTTTTGDLLVTEVQPGDVLTQGCSEDEVTVIAVGPVVDTEHGPRVTLSGRITSGAGRSAKVYQWTYPPEATVDVRRWVRLLGGEDYERGTRSGPMAGEL